jgi:hypothetical protein
VKLLPLVALSTVLLTGCSTLLPKQVEFFQKKVQAVPEATSREKETQKEAAALAAKQSEQTLLAAVKENASTNVVKPAGDAMVLSRSVSTSLGPPVKPWAGDVDSLARKLDTSVAALDRRLDNFREDQSEVVGKKIEGTGLFQVPYLVWLGIVFVFVFVGLLVFGFLWTVLKMYATTNPPLAIGLNAAQAAASTVRKGFTQAVVAGEEFKKKVLDATKGAAGSVSFSDEQATAVLDWFRTAHQKNQDHDVQELVKGLTQK